MSETALLPPVSGTEIPEAEMNERGKGDHVSFAQTKHSLLKAPSVSSTSYAPWYSVPRFEVVSIEHPFIIKHTEKGITSLGGPERLQELVEDSDNATARLYLHPGNRMSKPLQSTNRATNNVLLKVTVPKRTGLKRRKGSRGPYYEGLENIVVSEACTNRQKQSSLTRDARHLVRTMCDNPATYQVQVTGVIERTHRFRGSPDFVISTANMPFMKKMQEHILPSDYERMKNFAFDLSKGPKPNTEIIPPPAMTTFTHPFNYSYRHNPSVRRIVDKAGNVSLVSTGPTKTRAHAIAHDALDVPHGPPSYSPQVESLEPVLQRLIASARCLLEERPVWTRRALINSLPNKDWESTGFNSARQIFQHCGYTFTGGPWRDAIIRFGVDPRQDPKYRMYQTMMFMMDSRQKVDQYKWAASRPDHRNRERLLRKDSHIFDGETVSKDVKTWQVCDVTDPLIKGILATTNIRQVCHLDSDGWYLNGTWSKAKTIMKAKITAILTGVPEQHSAYARVAQAFPEDFKIGDKVPLLLGKNATRYESQLGGAIRASALARVYPPTETAPGRDGDSSEDSDDGVITMPDSPGEGVLDPRVAEAAFEFDEKQGGTAHIEGLVDGMDIDGSQESMG